MPETEFLIEIVAVLAAVVVVVPIFQKVRLGPVLGYLVTGMLLGPSCLGVVSDPEAVHTLAELGIVFLLFTVGLELPFDRIKVMPPSVYGLSAAQIVVTGAAVGLLVLAIGGSGGAAVVVGGALALSSTAIVLRLLSDRRELTTRLGRTAFAILIIQDLAVGPLLVCVVAVGEQGSSLVSALGWAGLKGIAALAVIIGLGRRILRPLLGTVAAARTPEIFAALTILIVLATGLATKWAGLSMAFGAFLAGMLLAGTTYRLQVAAEIQPFRGLLLGLFFITVGMSLDLQLVHREFVLVVLLATAVLVGKTLLLGGLARAIGLPTLQALSLGLLLSQGGEFAFVLVGEGIRSEILPEFGGQVLIAVVTLTMLLTPLLAVLARRISRYGDASAMSRAGDKDNGIVDLKDHVVIAGFGRVGQAVARQLTETNVPFVAVDLDPLRISQARQRGGRVFYGDATRPEVLEAVHVERARAVVVALDDPRSSLQAVALIRYIFPDLKVFARAYDDAHGDELRRAGAAIVVPEVITTGRELAQSILRRDERV